MATQYQIPVMDSNERKKYRDNMRRMSQALMDRKLEAISQQMLADPSWYPGKFDPKAQEKAQNSQAYGQVAQLGGMVVGSQLPGWLGYGSGAAGGGLFGGGTAAAGTAAGAGTAAAAGTGAAAGAGGGIAAGTAGIGAELGSGLGGSFISSGVASGAGTGAAAGAGTAGAAGAGTAGAAGAGTAGAAGAGTATAGVGVGTTAAAAAPYLGAAAAGYGAYDAYKNRDDWDDKNEWESGARRGGTVGAGAGMAAGSQIGSVGGPWGMAIGAVIGALAGTAMSQTGGGKDKDQRRRDMWRAKEVERGFLTPDYRLNGFDVGRDGEFLMREGDESSKPYNVDFNDEASVKALGDVNALATLKAHGNEKMGSDIAGYMTNATKGGGGSSQELFQKSGYDRNSAYQGVLELAQKGLISNEKRDAHLAEIDRIFGVKNPNA